MSEVFRRWLPRFRPDRYAWVRLLASPSCYLLVLATVVSSIAKLRVIATMADAGGWPLHWMLATASDVALFLGCAALFSAAEAAHRWLLVLTIPLAVLIGSFGIGNAAFISVTGEQLNWQTVQYGVMRFDDLRDIVDENRSIGPLALGGLIASMAIVGAALFVLRRAGQPLHPTFGAGARATAALSCAVIGLIITLLAPTPQQHAVNRLYGNAVARTFEGLLSSDDDLRYGRFEFHGYTPRTLVDEAAVATLRAGSRPNIVLVVLESTGRHVTTLGRADAPARTPNLIALARRGTEVVTARAVMPHTTKSLWSMHCARIPFLQHAFPEITAAADTECLPALLGKAGWRTKFFQSAVGNYESRPRLVHQMGFQGYMAQEDLGGQRLGYLGGDDEPLAVRLIEWIDEAPGQPFMATLLTSGPHHEYELTETARRIAREDNRPSSSELDRHALMVEVADLMIGRMVEALRSRGLIDNTIVFVVGDHGEGFGDKGFRQHANNFYEEALRVPWVMAGPGIPVRRIEPNASLLDVTPTLLDVLGLAPTPAALAAITGRSVLGDLPAQRQLPFACLSECRGFVEGSKKVVLIPETNDAFWFDLVADPREAASRTLTDEIAERLPAFNELIDAHRYRGDHVLKEITIYSPWSCLSNKPCTHPREGERRTRPSRAHK